jgi:hypothetical protein
LVGRLTADGDNGSVEAARSEFTSGHRRVVLAPIDDGVGTQPQRCATPSSPEATANTRAPIRFAGWMAMCPIPPLAPKIIIVSPYLASSSSRFE